MSRIIAFLVWALAAASAVFWGLRVFSQPLAPPSHAQPVAVPTASPAAVARLFAAPAEAPAATPGGASSVESSRFQLLGVMAPHKGGRGGVALISVDGRPPRAYRPGAPVTEGLVLQQVGKRSATLGPAGGAGAFTLEVPPLPEPNTGTLPPAADGTASSRPASPPPAPEAPRPAERETEPDEPQPGAPSEAAPDEEPSHRRPS